MPMNEFRITFVPRWADIDANQHLKNTAFSEWATYVRSEWLASFGFDVKKLMELKFSVVIFEDSTRYLKEGAIKSEVQHSFTFAILFAETTRCAPCIM